MVPFFNGNNYARETLTSSSSAQQPTQSIYRVVLDGQAVSPRYAVVTVETNPIRFTRPTPPTTPVDATPVGQLHGPTTPYQLVLIGEGQIENFRFVQNTGAGKVHFEYFR